MLVFATVLMIILSGWSIAAVISGSFVVVVIRVGRSSSIAQVIIPSRRMAVTSRVFVWVIEDCCVSEELSD